MTHLDAVATTGCKTCGQVLDRPNLELAALWRAYAAVLERERVQLREDRKRKGRNP